MEPRAGRCRERSGLTMTADILAFPLRRRDAGGDRLPVAGDLLVGRLNARTLTLWVAWPVVRVEDGRIEAVERPGGGVLRASDLMDPDQADLYRAVEHRADGFLPLRFNGFPSREAARDAFAQVAL